MGAIMQHLESVSGTSGRHVRPGQCWILLMSDAGEISQSRPSSPSLTRGNFRSQGGWIQFNTRREEGTKRVAAMCLLGRERGLWRGRE